jgi:hypothetical protein
MCASAAAARPDTSAVVERTIREMGAKAALNAAAALPLVVDGAFIRSAIMKQALAAARLERARGSLARRWCIDAYPSPITAAVAL